MVNNLLLRQKYHQYKMFTPAGAYLGLLQNVQTPFNYNQQVATTFAQMQLEIAQSADNASQANEAILDEMGNPITDEAGNNLMIERQPDVVGSTNSKALIANNNLIQAWEYSNYYPNGLLVFSGYISKWKTKFGAPDNIEITCISSGQDMSQILVQSGDTLVINQNTDNSNSFTSSDSGTGTWILQTFSASSVYQLSAVSLELTTTAQNQVQVIIKQQLSTTPQPTTDTIVASGTAVVPIQTKTVTKISMTQPVALNPAYTYYMQILWQDTASTLTIFSNSTQPYGSGNVYTLGSSGTVFNTPVLQTGSLYFLVWQYGGNVTGAFTNEDPSLMLTQVMSNYTSQGGLITPPASTISAVASQSVGDASIPGGSWGTAVSQVINSPVALTFDTLQIKLPTGVTSVTFPALYKGDPSLDTMTVTAGRGGITLGGSNSLVATPSVLSSTINGNNGYATIKFSSRITLTANTAYYLNWTFDTTSLYTNAFYGASATDPTPASPWGALYTSVVNANNSSVGMSKPGGINAMYMVLGLGAGATPNGGYSNTGTLATYTFKMQTVLQAVQTILGFAPANWYWYVDPATGVLNFAQANTVADVTLIRGRHMDYLEIEATKENIKNTAYMSAGDDGTSTSTNILVKVTSTQGTNRKGLALLADNRINSTNGGTTAARLVANNFLNNNANETYIATVTVEDQAMDVNLIKLGMMIAITGFGNFVETLLLQVVGIARTPDQAILQIGTLPLRDSQQVAQLQAQLQYLQTVAVNSTPS